MAREPYFVAVGAWVEDRRDDRPHVCKIPYGEPPNSYGGERTYEEACDLAWEIADALNRCHPRANNAPRAKKETA